MQSHSCFKSFEMKKLKKIVLRFIIFFYIRGKITGRKVTQPTAFTDRLYDVNATRGPILRCYLEK